MEPILHSGPHDPEGPPAEIFVATDTGFTNVASLERLKFARRIKIVLAAAMISFALACWFFVRRTITMRSNGQDPVQVVRMEIGALGRGDLEAAYSQLSERYRSEVPFEMYHQLVVEHRRIFFARSYRVTENTKRGSQTFVVAQIEAAGGAHYTAQFTLVQLSGRWWIDDLHWNATDRKVTKV